jgi:hypothetical protein
VESNKTVCKCWICGEKADSREHRVKHSDLKNIIGKPTQKAPFYLRDETGVNHEIKGGNVDLLVWDQKICSNCNNALTAPYDRAWEVLSAFLMANKNGLSKINLKEIYGKDFFKRTVDLQLYFVKLLGFGVISVGANVQLDYFKSSLLSRSVHPDVYLRFAYFENWPKNEFIHLSDLYTKNDRFGPFFAAMAYGVGPWGVYVAHWLPRGPKPEMVENGFQPIGSSSLINVSKFKE